MFGNIFNSFLFLDNSEGCVRRGMGISGMAEHGLFYKKKEKQNLFTGTGVKPFENKIWLASPTMHGEELEYIHDAFDKN